MKTSSSCIFNTSDDIEGIAMMGKLVEIGTDWNCYRQTLIDVMDSLTDISSYIEDIVNQTLKRKSQTSNTNVTMHTLYGPHMSSDDLKILFCDGNRLFYYVDGY